MKRCVLDCIGMLMLVRVVVGVFVVIVIVSWSKRRIARLIPQQYASAKRDDDQGDAA